MNEPTINGIHVNDSGVGDERNCISIQAYPECTYGGHTQVLPRIQPAEFGDQWIAHFQENEYRQKHWENE